MFLDLDEAGYEAQVLEWLSGIGWTHVFGPEIAPNGLTPERESFKDVILAERLEDAIARINPNLTKDVVRRVRQRIESPGETDILKANQLIHQWFTEGMQEQVRHANGEETTELVRLIDFENIENNDWAAVNQFRSILDDHELQEDLGNRVPDIVLFVNGIPLAVIELKNPSNSETTIQDAFNQLQTYKEQIGRLFY